jgi:hypothetical protein
VVFYSGQSAIDQNGRYAFPQVLARDAALLVALSAVAVMIGEVGRRRILKVALSGAAVAAYIGTSAPSWRMNHLSSLERVRESSEFTREIETGATFLQRHPDAVLLLNSHDVFDIEPVWAVRDIMRASGIANPIAVKINGYSSAALRDDPVRLHFALAEQLESIQARGNAGRFTPLGEVPPDAPCYSYGLNGLPASGCAGAEILWPPGASLEQWRYKGPLLFSKGQNGVALMVRGWSSPEDWGVWSNNRSAEVVLFDPSAPTAGTMQVVIEARGFAPGPEATQHVHVRLNGVALGSLALNWDIVSSTLEIPHERLRSPLLTFEFVPERPMSPAHVNGSSDDRLLGIGLKSLELRPLDATR